MDQTIKTKAKAQAASQTKVAPASKLQDIPASDFADVKVNPKVLRQVVVGYLANQQRSTAHAKTRGQVSGGGRKPWRQKGTGRARTGSIRNPIWRGGGIIFGPSNKRNYSHTLPTQLRRQALAASVAVKAKSNKLKLLQLDGPLAKTKEVKTHLPEVYGLRRVLLVVPDGKFKIAFKNLPNITPVLASRMNALDILSAHNIIFINDTYKRLMAKLKI